MRLASTIALALLLTLGACWGSDEPAEAEGPAEQTPEAQPDQVDEPLIETATGPATEDADPVDAPEQPSEVAAGGSRQIVPEAKAESEDGPKRVVNWSSDTPAEEILDKRSENPTPRREDDARGQRCSSARSCDEVACWCNPEQSITQKKQCFGGRCAQAYHCEEYCKTRGLGWHWGDDWEEGGEAQETKKRGVVILNPD